MNKRILMINNEFPPMGGGTATVNLSLLREFAKCEDLEIDLITGAAGKEEIIEQFSPRIRIYRLPLNVKDLHHASNYELAHFAFKAFIKARSLLRHRSYKICFAWSALPAGAVARALKLRYKLPYFVRVCGPDIPGFEERYQFIYTLFSPLIRSVWRHANVVVAKCDEEVSLIRACDSSVKTTIIPNGIDLSAFPQKSYPLPEGPLKVLCVGRLIERKRQRLLIEAVAALKQENIEIQLTLVGSGDDENNLKELTRTLNISQNVIFAGNVPREKIVEYYHAAEVFALPSYNEGMSVATLEAMACGLPVIVSNTGGISMMVEDGKSGWVLKRLDTAEVSRSLRKCWKERNRIAQMGVRSRANAEKLALSIVVAQYLESQFALSKNIIIGPPAY